MITGNQIDPFGSDTTLAKGVKSVRVGETFRTTDGEVATISKVKTGAIEYVTPSGGGSYALAALPAEFRESDSVRKFSHVYDLGDRVDVRGAGAGKVSHFDGTQNVIVQLDSGRLIRCKREELTPWKVAPAVTLKAARWDDPLPLT
jgi:hypothetical protein